jgi:hypothetical protein
MKMPKGLAPIKSNRCSMAEEMEIEREDGTPLKRWPRKAKFLREAWAFKIRSVSVPSCAHLQTFNVPAWNESRVFRALILREARRALADKVKALNA